MTERGSIEELPSGAFRIRLTVEGKRKTVFRTADRQAAERMLDAVRWHYDQGNAADPGTLTFESFAARWLDRREVSGDVLAVDRERSVFAMHVSTARFAKRAIETIAPRDVVAWIRELRRKPAVSAITKKGPNGEKITSRRPKRSALSRQVIKHALRLLRQCLDAAEIEGLITTNPARAKGVDIPKEKTVRDEPWTVYDLDEVEALTRPGVLSEQSRHGVAIAFFTGLRLGELRQLRWSDLDLSDERPRMTVKITKASKLHRAPLLPQAATWLRAWRAHPESGSVFVFESDERTAYAEGFDFAWAGKRDGDRVYPSALERAGLTGRAGRFHDLRHSFVSHLLMGSFGEAYSLEEAAAMVGHSTAHVTARYGHLAPDHLDAKAAKATREIHPAPVHVGPRSDRGDTRNPAESLADPSGFEPLTFGSGGRRLVA